jgi:MerR family transcriptional regulator, copper efflux regulator
VPGLHLDVFPEEVLFGVTHGFEKPAMNIGKAATASGVSAKTIRYYEAAGLIATAVRGTSGYRVYTQADVFTLRFIKRARELGFSIERIRRLLDLWQDKSRASRDVKRLALDHIAEIRAKIAAMTSMRDAVQELADACDGDERPECPILRDLEDAAAQPMPGR